MHRLRARLPDAASRIVLRSLPGARLTDAQLLALRDLRADVLPLKPEVDPEADRAAFTATLRSSAAVSWAEVDGAPVAMASTRVLRLAGGPEGRVFVFVPEYGLARAEHRGPPTPLWVTLRCALGALRPGDLTRTWYLGNAGYPSAYLFFKRLTPQVWLDGEPGTPPRERAVIARIKQHLGEDRYHPTTGVVTFPTVPPPLRPELERHPEVAVYESLNPRWREGHGLTLLMRGSPGVLGTMARRALARRRRR